MMDDDPMIVDSSLPSSTAVEEGDTNNGKALTDKENNRLDTAETSKTPTSTQDKDLNMTTATKTKNKSDASTTSSTATNFYAIPWVEKFRPRTLDDVLGNVETVIRLRAIAKDGNLPNLILCGPPGTGTGIFDDGRWRVRYYY
jgi:ATP-dependent Clp protease ATP-binding subunit ClpA